MRYFRYILLSFLFLFPLYSLGEPIVIVNINNPISSLTSNQTANLFLVRTGYFPNELKCIPVNLTEGNTLRETFYNKVVGKNTIQLKSYWSRLIFTGQKLPPIEFQSSEKIKSFVSRHVEAIAYIDSSDVDSSVKTISIND
jgi:hypothetical protein